MKGTIKLFLFSIILGVLGWSYQIVTGSPTGTYYKIGKDLKRFVADPINLNLKVVSTKGSVENLKLMAKDRSNRFGIVQQDVIDATRRSSKMEIRLRAELVKLLLPLYIEEAHLIVRKESPYQVFEDLRGKKYGVVKESGSALTSALLGEEVLGTPSNRRIKVSSVQDGLQKLKNGEIEWFLLVCGQPCSQIRNLDGNLYRLLPFNPNRQYLNYEHAKILPKNYPNLHLTAPLPTIGVRSLLIIRDSSDPQLASDVRKFAIELYKKRQILQTKGHPKWRNVPFKLIPIAGWKYYPPFQDGWEIGKGNSTSGGGCSPADILRGSCK
jgi:hypothetical protein